MTPEFTRIEDVEQVFENAWSNPAHTRITLPPLDVNSAIDRFGAPSQQHLTATDLWNCEVQKARDPKTYIPVMVRTSMTLGRGVLADGTETFVRISQQRSWLSFESVGSVIERTFLDYNARRATFLGTPAIQGPDGAVIRARTDQALFHVQHGVGGSESSPHSLWRIVHLTSAPDERILARFDELQATMRLPEYVSIYLERNRAPN